MIIWISFDIIIYQWENRLNEDMVYIYIYVILDLLDHMKYKDIPSGKI